MEFPDLPKRAQTRVDSNAKDEGSVQEPLAITRRTITHLLRGLNFDTLESIPGQKPSNGRTKNDMLVV
jgi:hypothetical protein